jgi:hypothetical protein
VVDTKAVAADMQAAVAVDMKAAAGATKLLLHRAAVCTTDGGANQLRRFALSKAFQIAPWPDGHRIQMDKLRTTRFAAFRDGASQDQLWPDRL